MQVKPLRILLLEDSQMDAELIQAELQKELKGRFTLVRVADREAFKEKLTAFHPDLVLSDYRLPGYDGLTALSDTEAMGLDIPFIIVTGTMDEETAAETIKSGAWDYVVKQRLYRLPAALNQALKMKTERDQKRRAEEELRESERRYRAIFENTGSATVIIEADTTISLANQKFVELSGYSREEIEGRMSWTQFVEPQWLERMRDYHHKRRQSRDAAPRQYEFDFRDRSGQIRHILLTVDVIPGKGKSLASLLDVTARRELDERIRQSQKIEVVGQLAGGVAHDFNNLLTVISGYSDMILAEKELTPVMRQRVNQIRRAGERAQKLTNQLLAFSRKQMVQPESMDLNRVIRESMGMLPSLIGEDIKVVLELVDPIPTIVADPHQIEQVLINLVVNARDAIREKGAAVELRCIRITTGLGVMLGEANEDFPAETPGPAVVWTVEDTGVGMDKFTQSRIFEPFYTTKETGQGTGLGLASVFGIIRQNNADIRVISEPGKGSVFRVFWPVERGGDYAVFRDSLQESSGGHETILLVDRDDDLRAFTRVVLEQAGYHVTEASDGESAMDLLADPSFSPQVMITDLEMPGIRGERLVKVARRSRSGLHLIATEGFYQNHEMKRDVKDSGLHFLQKPYLMTDLIRLIRRLLGNDSG
ncbi:MAG TPA: hybrid sensor histidine kinase/response regulator [Candidatus Aminicenantes bacterium]|nr:hybrid sensor histidine kinase/response regulator [Candidatus Aminicenantes bacterium]